MKPIFVTATGTGVGKTYATLRLIEAFCDQGVKVGVLKPLETGVIDLPSDAEALWNSLQRRQRECAPTSPEELCFATFPLPAAPFCADREKRIDPKKLLQFVTEKQNQCDLLIIEGAGGLMVPITRDYFMIDLLRDLYAYALLVTPSRLGCINETLLSLEALKKRNISHDWCVNLYEDAQSFPEVTRPFYDAAFPGWWSLQEGVNGFVERYLQHKGTGEL